MPASDALKSNPAPPLAAESAAKPASAAASLPFECAVCSGHGNGVCAALQGDALALLNGLDRRTVVYRPGQVILSQGETNGRHFNLLSGWVQIYRDLPDGRRQILRILLPGAAFGHQPLGSIGRLHTAEALSVVRVCVAPAAQIARLRHVHVGFDDRYVWMMERDSDLDLDQLASLGQQNASERVAHLMMSLAIRCAGGLPEAPFTVEMPLNQRQIGEAVGLTAIHVNRCLRQLRERGLMSLSRGALHVLDPRRAMAVGGVPPEMLALWSTAASAQGPNAALPPPVQP